MKFVIISAFWNADKLLESNIKILKNQTFTNFIAYFIDDMSTDNSYNIAKKSINGDKRFILIKNGIKKWKTKNFVGTIINNSKIDDEDVIIEIDGDDRLIDETIINLLNNVYKNRNTWICGSKWLNGDKKNVSRYGKCLNPDGARHGPWAFSHLRTYKAFLFRAIKDSDLKMNNEYFKAACDFSWSIPMLEMSGKDHYHFLNKFTYLYRRTNKDSGTQNSSHGIKDLQINSARYIIKLPKYNNLIRNNNNK